MRGRAAVRGGGRVARGDGRTSLSDEWGQPRADFALGDLLGVQSLGGQLGVEGRNNTGSWEQHATHNYLRLENGPDGARHAILKGFEDTDIVGLGGTLCEVAVRQSRTGILPVSEAESGTGILPVSGVESRTGILPVSPTLSPSVAGDRQDACPTLGGAAAAEVLASYVPAFPIYPPEFSWMREPRTDRPAILAREASSGDGSGSGRGSGGGGSDGNRARVVYFAADVDRAYGRTFLPDQGDLLAAAAHWVLRDEVPLRVEGPGYLDCHLYRQASPARWLVHLVNLTGCNVAPGYLEEHLPVGPLTVRVRLREGEAAPTAAALRVAGGTLPVTTSDGWAVVRFERILDHELVVLEARV